MYKYPVRYYVHDGKLAGANVLKIISLFCRKGDGSKWQPEDFCSPLGDLIQYAGNHPSDDLRHGGYGVEFFAEPPTEKVKEEFFALGVVLKYGENEDIAAP